jgi:hypothetical protein
MASNTLLKEPRGDKAATGTASGQDGRISAAGQRTLCRFCDAPLQDTVVDLGMSPLCESFLKAEELDQMEPFYPLVLYVCRNCYLVQMREYVGPRLIFSEYAYFSSFSDSWLQHARTYADYIIDRLGLTEQSQVVEVASNDGYLLQYFIARGIPSLGIEPAANIARAAERKGVPTQVRFFGEGVAHRLARHGKQADLLIGNNVLAQAPGLNGFVEGFRVLLKPNGCITVEFPHLMRLIEGRQFDTIYHEHFSYFSLFTIEKIFAAHGLKVFDVEELPTHGGSLRVFAGHAKDAPRVSGRVTSLRERELADGVNTLAYYARFGDRVKALKRDLIAFLVSAREEGRSIAGYGAPGKGNTLLNYCGIRTDLLDYTVDRNPYKIGKYLPGTHIPIHAPETIKQTRPDYVLILPWNLKNEIASQLSFIREWGGRFVVPIPALEVW